MNKRISILAFLIIALVSFSACSDDDSFTTDPASLLTFENDTISLDTIFSTVPSPHKQMKAYNRNGKGLRITDIRLETGNQSGFRVNVNGTYLSPETGYKATDMELRKGDSLRIFVEMTSRQQESNEPQKVEDNLVFTLESGIRQRVNLNAWSWDAEMMRDLFVSQDSVIDNSQGKPIVIYGNIKVDTTATLTIAPGSTLYFHGNSGIDVCGTLKAVGEVDKEITFRCDRLDRMVSNLMYDNNPGQWNGIRFAGCSYDNEIAFCDIHSGTDAIVCDSSLDATKQKLYIRNSSIHNMKGAGLSAIACNIKIENTQLSNAFNRCASFLGGNIDINNSTIAQYYPFDAGRGPALYFANKADGYDYPLTMRVKNSIVKGYANDVITWSYGGEQTETPLDAKFDNCLLRTPMPTDKDSVMFVGNILENVEDPMTSADSTFVLFDTHFFFYDFTPKSTSQAIGNANPQTSLPIDRKGKERSKERPDIGCYETTKE